MDYTKSTVPEMDRNAGWFFVYRAEPLHELAEVDTKKLVFLSQFLEKESRSGVLVIEVDATRLPKEGGALSSSYDPRKPDDNTQSLMALYRKTKGTIQVLRATPASNHDLVREKINADDALVRGLEKIIRTVTGEEVITLVL